MIKNKILFCFIGFFFCSAAIANIQEDNIGETQQEERRFWGEIKDYTSGILKSASVGVEYRVKAGIAIGGTSPIPLAPQIREIKRFNPRLNISLEGEIMKMFNDGWGFAFGLRLETRGMKTKARVKGYSTAIEEDGESASGVFTGIVETEVSNSYLTLPVLAVWRPHPRWGIKLGPYCSYLLSGKFSGKVYDGYFREGDPTGEPVEFLPENPRSYEFSSDLRKWNWGAQLGGEWRAFSHLLVSLDLNWGLNTIFKKDFDTITFNMYPIYGALSFGYAF